MADSNSKPRTRKQIIEQSVQDRIDQLKNVAHQRGLSSEDFDDCIILALESKRQANPLKPVLNVCRKLMKGLIVGVAVLVCFCLVISYHRPSRQYFELVAFNSSYPVMRAVRLLTLPLARRVDLTSIYYSECTLPNPFYDGVSSIDCYPCQPVTSVEIVQASSSIYGFGRPFVSKDPNINLFTYDDLKALHHKNQKIFSAAREDYFQSTNPYVHSTADVFADERKEQDIEHSSFNFEWRVASAGSVRLVRNQCGKPSFIPPQSEVFPEMFLILESSSSYAHNLPKPVILGYTWLSQAHGSREVVLSPFPQCKNNCTEISAVLEPGNALFVDTRYWELQSFPFGDEISISCMGSFA